MCFLHLGVFLISVKPLTTENTENNTSPKICKLQYVCFAFEEKLLFTHYSYIKMLAQLAFEKRNFVTLYRWGQIVAQNDRPWKKTLKGRGFCNPWHGVSEFVKVVA